MVHYYQFDGLPVSCYKTPEGNEVVKKWLKALDKEDRSTIGENIRMVQFGWPVGMPLVDSLGDGLWEIRSKLVRGRIARVIFFIDQGKIILLHGFIKKTQKTPQQELLLGKKRKSIYLKMKK